MSSAACLSFPWCCYNSPDRGKTPPHTHKHTLLLATTQLQMARSYKMTLQNKDRPGNWKQRLLNIQPHLWRTWLEHQRIPLPSVTQAYKSMQPRALLCSNVNSKQHLGQWKNIQRLCFYVDVTNGKLPTLFWRPGRRVLLIRECKSGSPLSLYSPLSSCALKYEAPSFTSSHLRKD